MDTKDMGKVELPVKFFDSEEVEFKTVDELVKMKKLNYGVEIYHVVKVYQFFTKMGLKKLRLKELSVDDRPFYSLGTWDMEAFVEDVGWVEITALNYRTDHDLGGHQKVSKTKLEINNDGKKDLI